MKDLWRMTAPGLFFCAAPDRKVDCDAGTPDLARAQRLLVTALRADAADLLPQDADLPGSFASTDELEQGLQEYRRALIEFELDRNPLPPISVPVASGGTVEVSQATLRTAMDAVGADRSAAQDRDQLALVAASLARSGTDVAAAIRAALPRAEARMATAAEAEHTAVAGGAVRRDDTLPEAA